MQFDVVALSAWVLGEFVNNGLEQLLDRLVALRDGRRLLVE